MGGETHCARNLPVSAAVRSVGVSRQVLHRIFAQTLGVSSAIALRLGRFCGKGPEFWLNLPKAHDRLHSKRDVDGSAISTKRAA